MPRIAELAERKAETEEELAEASAVQPFAYMQFVFITLIGLFVFGESLSVVVVLGVALVIAAGIYALWSERTARNG